MKGDQSMIDQDKLAEEIERLQGWLASHDPASEQYAFVQGNLSKLVKLSLEVKEAHDSEIERHDRNLIEEDKLRLQRIEDERRRHSEIRQILWDLVKMGFSTAMSFLLILGTGHIEQNVILGQHKWALIPKPKF